jgi:hypothetical protein
MNAFRNIYNEMPDYIKIPEDLRKKRGEVIILPLDGEIQIDKNPEIMKFYGAIPDFPERQPQGEYENREIL